MKAWRAGARRNPILYGVCLPGALLLRTVPTPVLLLLGRPSARSLSCCWSGTDPAWPDHRFHPLPPRDAEPHSHSASSLPSGSAAGCPGRPYSAGGACWSSWRWAGPPPCRTASSPTPTGSRSSPGARGGNRVGAGHRHRRVWVFFKNQNCGGGQSARGTFAPLAAAAPRGEPRISPAADTRVAAWLENCPCVTLGNAPIYNLLPFLENIHQRMKKDKGLR